MINLAGREFDLANVVHSIIAECEHRRHGAGDDLPAVLTSAAREKLATVRRAYLDQGGGPEYWSAVEREVEAAMRRYMPLAMERNRLEETGFDVWRRGDPAARAAFALAGLVLGGIIIALPFIPIFEDTFAFALAFGGVFYPDLKRLWHDYSFTRALNSMVRDAALYQQRSATEYLTAGSLERMLATDAQGLLKNLESPRISSGDSQKEM